MVEQLLTTRMDEEFEDNKETLENRVFITKIRDSEAGGLHSVKNEDYFHGFLPKEQTYDLLVRVGDFLVRQAVRVETKSFTAWPATKSGEELEDMKRQLDAVELRHIQIKYSRRAKLYYVRMFGFKLVSGLIEYHRRNRIPFDEEGTVIKRAIKRGEWQLNHEQIIKTKKLGDGAFGDVYKGVLHTGLIDSKEVAIKTIIGSISNEENDQLFREAMLMRRLVHPNVVMLIGVASNEEPVMIVMEFAPGGSVLDAVRSKPGPSVYVRIKYCYGAAMGLQYLSKEGIIHRDVAARNCLIGKHDVAKISDFGLSIVGTQKKEKTLKKKKKKYMSAFYFTFEVPVRYLAPETLKMREYTVKTDVWSYGVFVWEVFHDGSDPYGDMSAKEVRKYVLSGHVLENESDHFPMYMWKITLSCFARNPKKRPDFETLAERVWSDAEQFKEQKKLTNLIKFW
ncbi:SH2 domain protein [Dictyocaulus viviparus]|uniref:Tyrosine-protein kinase n=1 Tax=Dictyocaulus viviparus TaxID=29172 RepID=A0A0D8XPP4_DICVI|nr:SH2 domain protein [Dictyocaulus viviparus]